MAAARWPLRRDAGGGGHATSRRRSRRSGRERRPPYPRHRRRARPRRARCAARASTRLVVDASGRFVATPDARRLFDYFLATAGEEPVADIRARIVAVIDRRLSGDAARDATALLDRYLAYRERARHTTTREDLLAARRQVLGADADALVADVTPLEDMAVEAARLANDPSLGPDGAGPAGGLEGSSPRRCARPGRRRSPR